VDSALPARELHPAATAALGGPPGRSRGRAGQAGKSTLIWKTLAAAGEPVLYLNCEEPSIREWLSSPAAFLADLAEVAGGVRTLFFEEVQRLPDRRC
jgi:hypothetical protein